MTKTPKILTVLVAVAALAAILVACGGSSSNSLAGTQWQMQDFANPANTTGMTTVLSGAITTIEFGKDDNVSGTGGCNDYTGTYTVDGDALTFGPLASTMKACGEPEGVMEQETVFMSLMQAATGYKLDGGQLHILNEKGQLVILLNPM